MSGALLYCFPPHFPEIGSPSESGAPPTFPSPDTSLLSSVTMPGNKPAAGDVSSEPRMLKKKF